MSCVLGWTPTFGRPLLGDALHAAPGRVMRRCLLGEQKVEIEAQITLCLDGSEAARRVCERAAAGPAEALFSAHNVVVRLRRCCRVDLEPVAAMLRRQLEASPTVERYEAVDFGGFRKMRRPARTRVNGRLDLGTEPALERWFFSTSRGSVNRDPADPRRRYLRAPDVPGAVHVEVYGVSGGLVVRVDALDVEVT